MSVHIVADDLAVIPLNTPEQPGFRDFISAWLLRVGGEAIVVDPGPACTVPFLVETLKSLGVHQLTGAVLTHIHMDHAGGIGQLVRAMPVEWVLAHPRAHRHLLEPVRLWEGSRKVLGDLADFYGPILPVDASYLRYDELVPLGGESLQIIETPGHAPHHLSMIVRDYVFVGEAIGVVVEQEKESYQRPATPPKFLPDIFLASIERLLQADLPDIACFGHFGWRKNARAWMLRGLEQTQRWMEIVGRMPDATVDEVFASLLEQDPFVARYSSLPEDIQQREKYFMSNSIKGMLQMSKANGRQ